MFKRHTEAEISELERTGWLQSKARGKNRFIWWAGVLPTLLIGFVAALAANVFAEFADHLHSFSVRSMVLPYLILLFICLLGGYMTGRSEMDGLREEVPGEIASRPWK